MIEYREIGEASGLDVLYIWIDEPLPADFERKLLSELLALAEPVGFSEFEAAVRKSENAQSILDKGVRDATFDYRGKRRFDDMLLFDYVSGYRLKVEYFPFGLSIIEDTPAFQKQNPGMPLVVSSEFNKMYGEGALQGAIKLALAADKI